MWNDFAGPFYYTVYKSGATLSSNRVYDMDGGKIRTFEYYNQAKDRANALGNKWSVKLKDWNTIKSKIDLNSTPVLSWNEFAEPSVNWRLENLMETPLWNESNTRILIRNNMFWAFGYSDFITANQSLTVPELDFSTKDKFKKSWTVIMNALYGDNAVDDNSYNNNAYGGSGSGSGGSGNTGSLAELFTTKNMIIAGVVFLALVLLIYFFL